jgi:hypothetical protein
MPELFTRLQVSDALVIVAFWQQSNFHRSDPVGDKVSDRQVQLNRFFAVTSLLIFLWAPVSTTAFLACTKVCSCCRPCVANSVCKGRLRSSVSVLCR